MGSRWWVAEAWASSPMFLFEWVFWVIFSITLHELGHGWAAIRAGDRTPIELGHMTWNPLVHMGQMSLLMFAIVGIAWGAMPVNPSRFRGRWDDAIVALAGPAMNLLLALACVIVASLWNAFALSRVPEHVASNVDLLFTWGAVLNFVLLFFNLIPVPPLDGSRVAATFFPSYDRVLGTEQGRMIALFAFIALFWFGGEYLFAGAAFATGTLMGLLGFVLP